MNEHKQFEIMCALAVVGQLKEADLGDLKLHTTGCAACQSRISDFAQISAQALPLSGEKYGNHRCPKAMTARFVERARAAGVPLRGSRHTLPSELLLRSWGWKGNLAAVLLLIMSIASGVSKFVHSRAQSADTVSAPQLELPSERSIQARGTLEGSALQQRERFTVQRPSKSYRNRTVLNSRLFSNGGDMEHPRFFRSERSGPNVPVLMAFAQYHPSMIAPDQAAPDPRVSTAMFASFSLNPKPYVVPYKAKQLLSDSPATRSDLHFNIDWYQLWLRTGAPSLRDSNDSSQYHRGPLGPEWPFSKESKADQP
jgi:hypothetical protein